MMGPFQVPCVLAAVVFAAAFSISTAFAQQVRGGNLPVPDKPNLGSIGERMNSDTISIVSGNINATYLSIAYDMSAVLDDGDEFRVLPVIGKGGGQNIRDVRFLKQAPTAAVRDDFRAFSRRAQDHRGGEPAGRARTAVPGIPQVEPGARAPLRPMTKNG
jgi:hypothetical protein